MAGKTPGNNFKNIGIMADNNNPIKYADLIKPDSSITDLIKQLKELDDTFTKSIGGIREEAVKLLEALKKVSGATEEGRDETKKYANDADRLARAEKELAFAQSENARKLAELNLAKKEQNQINKLIVKLNNATKGSYDALSAQYSLNKIRINQMSQAERDEAEAKDKLISKTKDLFEQMKRYQEETGKHQLNVGNYPEITAAANGYANKLTDILGLNSQFGESLLNLGKGGQGFVGILNAMGAGVTAFGKTLFGLLANPVFVAIAGLAAAGTAVKWWFDYNKGLVEATRLTQQFTGLAGGDLKQFRNEVQAIADVYDKDYKESLIAINALSKQYGIEASEALNLVRRGFENGADVNGEFIDTLKEYPAYFKEAGISAEGFVAIITQGAKQGVFSDKAVDAIKEGNLRIREMTKATADALNAIGISSEQVQKDLQSGAKTTFDIMQEVSAKLAELPDSSAKVGTAIADIFGGPGEDAGLQYLRTLKDITLNMDELSAKTGDYAAQQDRLITSEVELNNTISGLFDATTNGFEEMTVNAKIFANEGLTKIIKLTVDLLNWFISLYNESIAIRAIFEGVGVVFESLWDFAVTFIDATIQKFKALGAVIKGAFTLDLDEINRGFELYSQQNLNVIKKTFGKIKENVKNALNDISNGKIKEIVIPVRVEDQQTKKPLTGSRVVSNGGGGGGSTTNAGAVNAAKDEVKILSKLQAQSAEDYLKAEKERHDKRLALEIEATRKRLNAVKKGSEEEARLRQQMADANQGKDIYGLMGLDLDENAKESINMSVGFAMDALNQIADAKVAAAERAVAAADKEVDNAQRALDAELQARANGYANNVAMAQKELDLAKKNQAQAIKDQQKAQKQQAAIQTVQQIGNMVTATALIWSQMGFPWAIPAIAVMWASFATSKIKAAQLAKSDAKEKYANGTVELLEGGSHQSGNDIDLGTKPDGTKRRAEGGEFFAVINKKNSRRFRRIIPDVINSLNNGTFAHKYATAYDGGDGLTLNVAEQSPDLRNLSADVRAIREQNQKKIYTDGTGKTVIEYKNLKRRIN